MNTIMRHALAGSIITLAAALGACSSEPKGSVSESELKEIRATSQTVAPGMKKSDVFEKYKGANIVRLASTQIEGATVEEWKTEAFNDSKSGRDLSVHFLYFRNDVLVDMSDTRIDYRNDAALTKRWSGVAK